MNKVMGTSIRLFAITLLGLLAGCATERTGQSVDTRDQSPQGRIVAPSVNTEKAAQAPRTAADVQAPGSARTDDVRVMESTLTKQAAVEATKKPQHGPSAVAVPVIKNPPQEVSNPQPATRWSRHLTVTQERFLDRNENSLLRVYVDMSKAEVMSIMSDYRAGDWVNPCKQEKLMDSNGKIYDVVFYLSRRPVQSRPFNERLMTPVILRDDRVFAIGRYSLKKLRATSHVVHSTSIGCQHV